YDTLFDLVNYLALYMDWLQGGGFSTRLEDVIREASFILKGAKPTQGQLQSRAVSAFGVLESALLAETETLSRGGKFTIVFNLAVPLVQMLFLDWEDKDTETQINATLETLQALK